jgi:hypothetical protein
MINLQKYSVKKREALGVSALTIYFNVEINES